MSGDYVNWSADADPNTHVDKTNVAGYQPDTDEATQRAVAAAAPAPTRHPGRSATAQLRCAPSQAR